MNKAASSRFWGFLAVGFIALAGGIVMFFAVVPQRAAEIKIPRDVQLIFTQAYMQQNLIRNETGKFGGDSGVGAEDCAAYRCAYELREGGRAYVLVLRKNERMWMMDEKSPQAREVRVGGAP